jgi:hypothetical protein
MKTRLITIIAFTLLINSASTFADTSLTSFVRSYYGNSSNSDIQVIKHNLCGRPLDHNFNGKIRNELYRLLQETKGEMRLAQSQISYIDPYSGCNISIQLQLVKTARSIVQAQVIIE